MVDLLYNEQQGFETQVTLDGIDIDATLAEVESALLTDKSVSPALASMIKVLILVVKLVTNRIGLNSRNSSNPPSSDPNRLKPTRKKSDKKPGGQNGHTGSTLKQIDDPDEIEQLKVDRRCLPKGHEYNDIGIEKRQVVDIALSRIVTEYQAQVLQDETGKRFVAAFPAGVTKAVQYGNSLKSHAVYMSLYQLLPYKRIEDYFTTQLGIPISQGSLFNFNKEVYGKLAVFDAIAKNKLAHSARLHADETGINITGQRQWLHCAGNDDWTYYFPHEKRGSEAMDDINIIPRFKGILCHDHWKSYYRYHDCLHSLCNAHHLRELTRAHEHDGQAWAKQMMTFLEELNDTVHHAGGALDDVSAESVREHYRELLKQAEIECPPPDQKQRNGKRGRVKRSKSRNLLERLIHYEADVLRFMDNPDVPFTNNLGERDIRMTKVQQKISGCFRSWEGAEIFCRVRGYLSTCRKQGVNSSLAMELLFNDTLPEFV